MAAFDEATWVRTLPSLASSVAGMGASLRGAMMVCSCLEAAEPRQQLLRQHAAARSLLSLPFCKVEPATQAQDQSCGLAQAY